MTKANKPVSQRRMKPKHHSVTFSENSARRHLSSGTVDISVSWSQKEKDPVSGQHDSGCDCSRIKYRFAWKAECIWVQGAEISQVLQLWIMHLPSSGACSMLEDGKLGRTNYNLNETIIGHFALVTRWETDGIVITLQVWHHGGELRRTPPRALHGALRRSGPRSKTIYCWFP